MEVHPDPSRRECRCGADLHPQTAAGRQAGMHGMAMAGMACLPPPSSFLFFRSRQAYKDYRRHHPSLLQDFIIIQEMLLLLFLLLPLLVEGRRHKDGSSLPPVPAKWRCFLLLRVSLRLQRGRKRWRDKGRRVLRHMCQRAEGGGVGSLFPPDECQVQGRMPPKYPRAGHGGVFMHGSKFSRQVGSATMPLRRSEGGSAEVPAKWQREKEGESRKFLQCACAQCRCNGNTESPSSRRQAGRAHVQQAGKGGREGAR